MNHLEIKAEFRRTLEAFCSNILVSILDIASNGDVEIDPIPPMREGFSIRTRNISYFESILQSVLVTNLFYDLELNVAIVIVPRMTFCRKSNRSTFPIPFAIQRSRPRNRRSDRSEKSCNERTGRLWIDASDSSISPTVHDKARSFA